MSAQVNGAALEAQHQAVGILDDLKGHLVQLGGGAPVLVKLLQHNAVLRSAGDELEGAGAHGGGVLLVVIGGQDGGGEVSQELVVRRFQGDGHGLVIHLFHRLNGLEGGNQRLAVGVIGAPLNGIDHVVRGHGFAVMELHALTQGEGVGFLVVREGVALGNGRGQVAVRGGLHQALKHVEHDLFGAGCHSHMGVQALVQVLGNAHGDLVGLGGSALTGGRGGRAGTAAAGASAQYSAQHGRRQSGCKDAFLHLSFSFFIAALPLWQWSAWERGGKRRRWKAP